MAKVEILQTVRLVRTSYKITLRIGDVCGDIIKATAGVIPIGAKIIDFDFLDDGSVSIYFCFENIE